MSIEQTYVSRSEAETEALGAALAAELAPGTVVLLYGDLGAGKTVFSRGFARGLGITEPVSSPTYTIVQEYDSDPRLLHFDAYRLADEDELYAMGYDDYLAENALLVMEWAELVADALPSERLEITIHGSGTEVRTVEFAAHGERYEKTLELL